MRLKSLLVFVFAVALAACGGDDSNPPSPDSGGGVPDGGGAPDSGGGGTPDGAAGVTGLGQVCTGNPQCTAGGTNLCADLDQPSDNSGFCTLSCGTTPLVTDPQNAQPPAGGDATCQGAYTGASGTPMCALYSNDEAANTATWYCAVLCGAAGGQNLGDCPGGLTCQQNLCDD